MGASLEPPRENVPFHRHFLAQMGQDFWLVGLLKNLFCYGAIIGVVWAFLLWLKRNGYLKRAEQFAGNLPEATIWYRLLIVFAVGHTPTASDVEAQERSNEKKEKAWDWSEYLRLFVCFAGLQGAYLTWGIAQERIMTQNYSLLSNSTVSDRFKDSQFLVFMNRISACLVAGLAISRIRQPLHRAPLFKYSYASFSNIMSSWFQYEALKFITFPTQVLGKASKIIIVMAMGRCVGKQTYPAHQYATSLLISLGVGAFLFSRMDEDEEGKGKNLADSTSISGFILMIGYLAFDSFTSNWQGELFKQYKVSSLQMMCGVNLFSSILTLTSLLAQGNFFHSLEFIFTHQGIYRDIGVLSICGAFGQLFIFYTIGRFGPVTFTIIMTIRQGAAILLSCLIYGHKLSAIGIIGVVLVFFALLLRTYLNRTLGSKPRSTVKSADPLLSVEVKG